MNTDNAIGEAARRFQVAGEFISAAPYGNGHIHDTYCAVFDSGGATARFVLQRINTAIFPRSVELMQNMERVTAHMAQCAAGQADSERRTLKLIPTRDGRTWHVDEQAAWWRMFRFIEGAHSVDQVESAEQCFLVAQAFGGFQRQLTTMAGPLLHDTIPNFHHTPKRFEALERAIAADAAGRVALAGREIEFALARKAMTSTLLDAELPMRITHNDTKINNVLLENVTGEAVCVIDLDTVMPGLALYDFGDMVRTATSPAAEDERDLDKVGMRFEFYEALLRGYLSAAQGFLTAREKELLAFSGKLITFETGIRFLGDYLAGDTYFKVHREGHNLDRCRTQFKLVESIERQEHRMSRLVRPLG